jgi:hypothetical protein
MTQKGGFYMSKGRCCSSGCGGHGGRGGYGGCGGGLGGFGGGNGCWWIIILILLCSCNGIGGRC